MSTYRIAHRYAGALMQLTAEQKDPEAAAADVMTLKRTIDASRELRVFLESPVITVDKKKTALTSIFEGKVGPTVLGLFLEIVEKGRAPQLAAILQQYFEMRDDAMGIVRASVTTPVDFTPEQKAALEARLAAFTGKKVAVTFSLDSSIRGGFIARVGDTVLDGSIRRRLELLRSTMAEGDMNN